MKTKKAFSVLLLLIFSGGVLLGCGGELTRKTTLSYIEDEAPRPFENLKVGIAPFTDNREELGNRVGKMTYFFGRVEHLTLEPSSISEAVTEVIEDYFRDRGATIVELPWWDQKPESLPDLGVDFAVGGSVEDLWVEGMNRTFRYEISTRLRMTLTMGATEKFMTVKNSIEIQPEGKYPGFASSEVLEESLNDALNEALERLLPDLEKRLL